MKNKVYRFLIPMALLPLLIYASSCNTDSSAKAKSNMQGASGLPADIHIVTASRLTEEEVLAGSVNPLKEVTIVSEVSKKVRSVLFKDGAYVKKGQMLYKLDDEDVKAKIKRINAELALAVLNSNRIANLLATESVNQQEYDEVATRLAAIRAEKELLLVDLEKTEIRAPFSGRIGINKVYAGAFVSPSTSMVTLHDLSSVKLEFAVPEKHLSKLRLGMAIRFSSGMAGEDTSAAIVSAIEPFVTPDSRSAKVHATAPNPKSVMGGGSSARIYLNLNSQSGIKIPSQALVPSTTGFSVFVVKSGMAKLNPVRVSKRTDAEAIISGGLENGDSVIISNILRLSEGAPVKAVTIN